MARRLFRVTRQDTDPRRLTERVLTTSSVREAVAEAKRQSKRRHTALACVTWGATLAVDNDGPVDIAIGRGTCFRNGKRISRGTPGDPSNAYLPRRWRDGAWRDQW